MEPKPEQLSKRQTLQEHAEASCVSLLTLAAEVGSVSRLVKHLSRDYAPGDEFKFNVFQLQRLSEDLVAPYGSPKHTDEMAAGFYWGALLGMVVGEELNGAGYSEHLLHTIRRRYPDYHQLPPTIGYDGEIDRSDIPLDQKLEKYFNQIELHEAELPQVYIDMIDELVPQLQSVESQYYYIKAGFIDITGIGWEKFEFDYHTETIKRSIDKFASG